MFQTRHASVSGSWQRKVHLFNAHAVVSSENMVHVRVHAGTDHRETPRREDFDDADQRPGPQ